MKVENSGLVAYQFMIRRCRNLAVCMLSVNHQTVMAVKTKQPSLM